jgi:hypothetical protein
MSLILGLFLAFLLARHPEAEPDDIPLSEIDEPIEPGGTGDQAGALERPPIAAEVRRLSASCENCHVSAAVDPKMRLFALDEDEILCAPCLKFW